jgi:O-antigen biosynthesis protein
VNRVSALVSAYYCAGYLEERLNNLTGCETIVVCKLNSPEHWIAKQYKDARLIVTPDVPTIGKAWNDAAKLASGEYLVTANADDLFLQDGLAEMADVLDADPEIGLVFSGVIKNDGTNRTYWKRVDFPEGKVNTNALRAEISRRSFIGPMPMWRKSLHAQVGYFDEQMIVSCDYDMWRRMAMSGVGFWYIPRALGEYLYRDDSLEHRNYKTMRAEMERLRAN